MFEFRELTGGDLERAWAIEETVFPSDSWSPEQLEAELSSADTYYVGAFSGDDLVGYAGVRGFYQADVMTLGVLPQWRGQGIGTRLVRDLLDRAKDRRWDPVFLEVRESNLSARALYAQAGFKELGRVRGYYRDPLEDAVRMGYSTAPESFR